MRPKCSVCRKTVLGSQNATSCDRCKCLTHKKCETRRHESSLIESVRTEVNDFPFICHQCHEVPIHESSRLDVSQTEAVSEVEELCVTEVSAEEDIAIPEVNFSLTLNSSIQSTQNSVTAPNISDINVLVSDSSQIDEDIVERSLGDETLVDPDNTVAEEELYTIIDSGSQKGKKKLVDRRGYTYVLKSNNKTVTYWRCSVRNKKNTCPASLVQRENEFCTGKHQHNHPANPGILTQVQVKKKVKDIARDNPFRSAGTIVEDVIADNVTADQPPAARSSKDNLVRMANWNREKMRPKNPSNLDFQLDDNHIPYGFLRGDVTVNESRHLLFATDRQLSELCKVRQWFLDATFKVVKRPFYQLLSIHGFVRSGKVVKMIPLFFIVMSRRRKIDYVACFRKLLDILPRRPIVQAIVLDFEKATWLALRTVLTNIRLRGCLFHLTQAIWKKVQELGLSVAYTSNRQGSLNKFVNKLMALPFLPASHIRPVFAEITSRVRGDGRVRQLTDYVERQWVYSTVFPVQSLSAFNQSVRTNNHVEGWHRRLNSKCGEQELNLYRLVSALNREASLIPVHVVLLEEKKIRTFVRETANKQQEEVFAAWTLFKNSAISAGELLTQCSRLHGPVIDIS